MKTKSIAKIKMKPIKQVESNLPYDAIDFYLSEEADSYGKKKSYSVYYDDMQ